MIQAILAGLLANNLPKVAQAVVDKGLDVVSEKLGVPLTDSLTPEEVAQVQANEFKLEELYLSDKASARDMQGKALAQDDWFAKNFVHLLAACITIASFAGLFMTENETVRTACVSFVTMIGGFYYGSSRSSKEKDSVIAGLTK